MFFPLEKGTQDLLHAGRVDGARARYARDGTEGERPTQGMRVGGPTDRPTDRPGERYETAVLVLWRQVLVYRAIRARRVTPCQSYAPFVSRGAHPAVYARRHRCCFAALSVHYRCGIRCGTNNGNRIRAGIMLPQIRETRGSTGYTRDIQGMSKLKVKYDRCCVIYTINPPKWQIVSPCEQISMIRSGVFGRSFLPFHFWDIIYILLKKLALLARRKGNCVRLNSSGRRVPFASSYSCFFFVGGFEACDFFTISDNFRGSDILHLTDPTVLILLCE